MFAKIIIDIRHEEVNQTYDYIIPEAFKGFLVRGMRVLVPFGAQERLGFVVEIMTSSLDATKSIIDVLDAIPTIDDELFMMIEYMKNEAPNLISSLFHTVVPSELFLNYHKEVHILKDSYIPDDLRPMFNQEGIWKLKQKDQIYYHRLKRLKDQEIIGIKKIIKQKETVKMVTAYELNPKHTYQKVSSYQHVLDLFGQDQSVSRASLLENGVSISALNTLSKHQVIIPFDVEKKREVSHIFELYDKKVILNDEQKHAYETIKKSFNQQKTFLLRGVTGSGKTEVYLALIEDVIKSGKQVLYLVPEITLIAPTALRLKSRFEDVAIYHSSLSKGERFDEYRRIISKKAQILLGTRSACFLPLESLGLIIIDEEHDASYTQTDGIIYDARHLSKMRSTYHQIPLVLGSATPQIVSMYQALNEDYVLLELKKRPNQIQMPTLKFVDMKRELKSKNTSIFSNELFHAITKRLESKEQTLLLFNRKGYAPFVLCRQCGDVPKCPHCDISLTYYKDKSLLKCHYCGFEKPFNKTCEVCHEDQVKEMGVGIEYVEQQLKKILPQARVLRMDQNTTRTKGSHELLWHQFQNEDADILLGTQMIAKGLDFPKVTLVGVLMADLLLKVPSYQADEKAYMLLSQVTGRSGRFLPGEAIIQSYDINHYAILAVKEGYDYFYKKALEKRKLLGYEPYFHTAQLLIEGPSFLKTYQQAFMIKKHLTGENLTVLGPTEAIIKRIKDNYRFTMTLKYQSILVPKLLETILNYETKDIKIKYYPTLDLV
jgi:primosomal protein N' (replication factor Y) (superfamily II helicase)